MTIRLLSPRFRTTWGPWDQVSMTHSVFFLTKIDYNAMNFGYHSLVDKKKAVSLILNLHKYKKPHRRQLIRSSYVTKYHQKNCD